MSQGDYLKKQQLAKVTKKVLDSHAKLSNPVQAIHYMDSNNDGLFSREQLQQALLYNGGHDDDDNNDGDMMMMMIYSTSITLVTR